MHALAVVASVLLCAANLDDEPVSFTVLYAHDREGALDPCG
ncbi:MAG: hypothetical protein ABIJ09_15835 [Pseudomonadota bacterium]